MSNDRSIVEKTNKTYKSLWRFFCKQPVEDKTLLSFQKIWGKPIHQLIEQVLFGTLNHYVELDERFEYSSESEKKTILLWKNNIKKQNILSTNEKLFLGIFYFYQKNYPQAKIYFQQITQKSGGALYYLGLMYLEGLGFSRNIQHAKNYFKQAEENYGLSDALNGLSAIARYYNQPDEMIKLCRIAAKKGNSEAQAMLGIIYEEGKFNIPKNTKIALEFYHQAAANGQLLILYYLGQIYSGSLDNYSEINTKRSVSYYQMVASKGVGEAIYNLGYCYARGIGTKQNKKMAIDLLNQAVEKGHYVGWNELGFLCESENQYQAAAKFYFDAIEKGVYDITIRMIRLFHEHKYQSSKDASIIIYYAGKTYALLHTSDKMKKIVDERKSTPEDKYKYDCFLSDVPYIFNKWAKEKPKELAMLLREQDPSLNLELLLQPDVIKTIRDENLGYLQIQEAEIEKALSISSGLFPVPVVNLISSYLGKDIFYPKNKTNQKNNDEEKSALIYRNF